MARLTIVVALSFLTMSTAAYAQPTTADKAAAEALFDEGRALLKDGRIDLACTKLAESQRLDPGVGTLMHLAGCYEKAGKLASAWVLWREAAMMARSAGQSDREKIAAARGAALDPRVPHLTIVPRAVTAADEPEPEITRDGAPVAKGSWGSATPVDPGAHVIEVKAPGRIPRTLNVTIAEGDRRTVEIPPLEREAAPAAVVAPVVTPPATSPPMPAGDAATSTSASPARTQRTIAIGIAGAGVIAVGVGAVFGARAMSLASDVDAACPSGPCTADVKHKADDSSSAGTTSTIAFIGGGALLATGAALFFLTPKQKETAWRIAPTIGVTNGVAFAGSFR